MCFAASSVLCVSEVTDRPGLGREAQRFAGPSPEIWGLLVTGVELRASWLAPEDVARLEDKKTSN